MLENSNILLKNGLILADPDKPEVNIHHNTLIQGGRLTGVNFPEEPTMEGLFQIDCSGGLIMPGLINGHTHAAMSLLRGVADDLPLEEWLNDYIFPAEAEFVNPDFVNLGSLLSCAEMALNGVTTFADGYFFMEQSALAAQESGLRAVVAQGVLDPPTPDAEAGLWKSRVLEFLDSCIRTETIKPAIFCHSPYLCGTETFKLANEMASENDLKLFSHVAETTFEVEFTRERFDSSPVEYLRKIGVLGPDFVAAHCVHVSDEEIRILADSGSSIIHCPESNMKLASGAARIERIKELGAIMGLGADGPASNNNLDLFQEMRTASLLAKLTTMSPHSMSAGEMIKMVTMDGARALGLESEIGSLKQGKAADLIVVDMNKPHLTPMYDAVSHLVYSAGGHDVRDVIVNGRIVVYDRSVITIDMEKLLLMARQRAQSISSALGINGPEGRFHHEG
jgi:5-methylthioadenosine/S-adenosylhomocysteine deaminase